MATVELKVLCVLLFAAFASAEVTPMTDFNLEQFAGKWYLVGFATNAEKFVKNYMAKMKMGTAMMLPTKDGDLDFSVTHLRSDGSCFRKTFLVKKTEIPGRFVFTDNDGENDNEMNVVDGKFDAYTFANTKITKDGKSAVFLELHSRTTTITDELKETFRQFCLDTGIPEENIVMLEKNGEC